MWLRSVMRDFVLLMVLLFCIVALSVLAWRGSAMRSSAADETFSPKLLQAVR